MGNSQNVGNLFFNQGVSLSTQNAVSKESPSEDPSKAIRIGGTDRSTKKNWRALVSNNPKKGVSGGQSSEELMSYYKAIKGKEEEQELKKESAER